MSDVYVECLVKAKPSNALKLFKYVLIVLTVLLGCLAFLTIAPVNLICFALAVGAGVGAYFVNMNVDLEYEYLYLDRELAVDKVMAKSKRKRVAVYSLDKIEILAPVKSYRLDNYKNRSVKVKDYSIGYEDKPDLRYAMYCEGGEKLLISPSAEMIKVMRSAAPRKVFSD